MAIMGHPGRFLRHKKDGTIYNYNDVLCNNPAVEEVSEEIAFPEKHIPAAQQNRMPKLDLSTDGETVKKTAKPKTKKAALAADASKGLK